jgi:hypothetical protein
MMMIERPTEKSLDLLEWWLTALKAFGSRDIPEV